MEVGHPVFMFHFPQVTLCLSTDRHGDRRRGKMKKRPACYYFLFIYTNRRLLSDHDIAKCAFWPVTATSHWPGDDMWTQWRIEIHLGLLLPPLLLR